MSDGDYASVNEAWGDQASLPKLTEVEALRAAKRLYYKTMGKAWVGRWKLTSGNRYSYPRNGIFYVNPTSWSGLVHSISHVCHRRLHPGDRPHDATHAALETEMIEYVRESGWLDGKLRPPPKEEIDPSRARYESICRRIESWERKEKRAVNALKKLRRKRVYYERKGLR